MEPGYQVIARRWRPQQFSELVGQDHIVRTLRNAIEQNRIAHAYLFVGPRGTGKTSTARLFAKALNADGGPSIEPDNESEMSRSIMDGTCMDVIEIDGASNNSVDDIRSLREECQYAPSQGRYKVYIIDEVHMLSTQAFNALLKTLEEPPSHVKFIFATTESQKVLPTIVSRCQRFEFRPIPEALIVAKLKEISEKEGIEVDEGALLSISRLARGGMRDSQSILDQMISFCGVRITEQDVLDVYGLASPEQVAALGRAIVEGRYGELVAQVEVLAGEGRDLLQLLQGLQDYFRAELLQNLSGGTTRPGTPSAEAIMRILEVLRSGESGVQKGLSQRVNFEVTLLKAAEQARSRPIDSVLRQIADLAGSLPGEAGEKKKDELNRRGASAALDKEEELAAVVPGAVEEPVPEDGLPPDREEPVEAEKAVEVEQTAPAEVDVARELTAQDLERIEQAMGSDNLAFLRGELRGEWLKVQRRQSRHEY